MRRRRKKSTCSTERNIWCELNHSPPESSTRLTSAVHSEITLMLRQKDMNSSVGIPNKKVLRGQQIPELGRNETIRALGKQNYSSTSFNSTSDLWIRKLERSQNTRQSLLPLSPIFLSLKLTKQTELLCYYTRSVFQREEIPTKTSHQTALKKIRLIYFFSIWKKIHLLLHDFFIIKINSKKKGAKKGRLKKF